MKNKKILVLLLLFSLSILLISCSNNKTITDGKIREDVEEQGWVFERPIEIIVPFGPGSGNDQTTRALMPLISSILGVPINVTNVEGGGGLVGMEHAATIPADGYTFFECSPTHIVLSLRGMSSISILEDFIPVIKMVEDVVLITGNKKLPFETWGELEKAIKSNPESLSLGGMSGVGIDYIATHLLMSKAGIDFRYVTFDNGSEMTAALLGGHLDAMTADPGDAKEYIEAGEMKGYLSLSKERLSILPDVPSSVELGYDVTFGPMRCVAVKKGTPQGAIDAFEEAAAQAVQTQEWKEYISNNALDYKPGFCGSKELAEIWSGLAESLPALFEDIEG